MHTAQVHILFIHLQTDFMEPLAILHADPLDLLFENRNKSYGAYHLRKYYQQRLLISMSITFSLVVAATLIYLCFPTTTMKKRIIDFPDTHLDPVYYPPKDQVIPPPVRTKPSRPAVSVRFVTPVIVSDQKIPEPMATVEKLDMASIALTTTSGEGENEKKESDGNLVNGISVNNQQDAGKIPVILERADIMPEFPGGIEALKRFLLKNLRMPENSLQDGTEVHVVARFVVGADGRVGNIEITRAADEVFNKEVKRVIAKMPEWKPGSQNHRNVAVYFSLPVNFVSAEQ